MNRKDELMQELDLLKEDIRNKELINSLDKLKDKDISVKEIAAEIYDRRGINCNKLSSLRNNTVSKYKLKDSKFKSKLTIECLIHLFILLLLKIPFDFLRDIGVQFIDSISTSNSLISIYRASIIVLYVASLIYYVKFSINNIKKKYLVSE